MIKIFDKLYRKYRDKRAVKEGYKDYDDKVKTESLMDMELPLDMVYSALCRVERVVDGVKYYYIDTQLFLVQEDINKPGMVTGEAIQLTGDNIGGQVHFCKTDMPENSHYNFFRSSVDFDASFEGKRSIYLRASSKYGTGEWILSVYSEQKNKPHHFFGDFMGKETMKLAKIVEIMEEYNGRVSKNRYEIALQEHNKKLAERNARRKMREAKKEVSVLFDIEKQ